LDWQRDIEVLFFRFKTNNIYIFLNSVLISPTKVPESMQQYILSPFIIAYFLTAFKKKHIYCFKSIYFNSRSIIRDI